MIRPILLKTYTETGANEVFYHGNFLGGGNFHLFHKFTEDKKTGITYRDDVHLVNKLPDEQMWIVYNRSISE